MSSIEELPGKLVRSALTIRVRQPLPINVCVGISEKAEATQIARFNAASHPKGLTEIRNKLGFDS
jgi:hypothetical protein